MRRLTNYLHLYQIKMINNQKRTEESIKGFLMSFPSRKKHIIAEAKKLLSEAEERGKELDSCRIFMDDNIQTLIDKELMKNRL